MHPYAHEAKASRSSKVKAFTQHTREQHGGMPSAARDATPLVEPSAAEQGLKHGGRAVGHKPSHRLDKRARGGRIGKSKVVINVMNGNPSSGDDQARPVPVPVPVPGGAPTPPVAPQMPGTMPGGMPGAPMMRKHGGRVPHIGEAKHRTAEMKAKMGNKKGYASGGRVHSYPKMDAGAGSAEGRIEKVAKYGKKA